MPLLLKPEFAKTVIGFNKSGLPLGERDDIYKLYEIAKLKNHKAHLNMFLEFPTEQELDDIKEKAFLLKREKKLSSK